MGVDGMGAAGGGLVAVKVDLGIGGEIHR